MRRLALMTAIALTIGTAVAWAETGVWTPDRNFVSTELMLGACSRVYRCGPAGAVWHSADQRVVSPPPKTVIGVCSTGGGGPIDSCSVCLTNPPNDPCEWSLERRQ
jgi:hypothetical protein